MVDSRVWRRGCLRKHMFGEESVFFLMGPGCWLVTWWLGVFGMELKSFFLSLCRERLKGEKENSDLVL
jgi:hypothetical protein